MGHPVAGSSVLDISLRHPVAGAVMELPVLDILAEHPVAGSMFCCLIIVSDCCSMHLCTAEGKESFIWSNHLTIEAEVISGVDAGAIEAEIEPLVASFLGLAFLSFFQFDPSPGGEYVC